MDIQRQAFESHFKTTEIYKREAQIRQKDILEFSSNFGYFNIIANNAWEMWQEAKAQKVVVPEGFVLVEKEMSDDLNDQLWDFMTDNFVRTNEDGDAFMECADFNLNMFYKTMIEAQEQVG